MSNFGDYAEKKIMRHLFHDITYTPPTHYYVGLSNDVVGEDGSSNNEPLESRGYTRQGIAKDFSITGFKYIGDGLIVNSGTLEFGPNTNTNWGTLSYFGLWDQSGIEQGNVIAYGTITNKNAAVGDIVRIEPGDIQISLDNNSLMRDLVSWWEFDEDAGTRIDTHSFYHMKPFGTGVSYVATSYGTGVKLLGDSYLSPIWQYADIDDIQTGRAGEINLTSSVAHKLVSGDLIIVSGNSALANNGFFTVSAMGTGVGFNVNEAVVNGSGGTYFLVGGPSYSKGIGPLTDSFTFSLRVILDQTGIGDQGIISMWSPKDDKKVFAVIWDDGLKNFVTYVSSDGSTVDHKLAFPNEVYYAPSTAYNLQVVYDADTDTLSNYVEGNFKTSRTGVTVYNGVTPLMIGATGIPFQNSGLMKGLVAYWSMEEAGGIRYDKHGGHHITHNNDGDCARRVGKYGYGLDLAYNDNLYIPNSQVEAFQPSGNPFAISLWMQTDVIDAEDTYISLYGEPGEHAYRFFIAATERFYFRLSGQPDGLKSAFTAADLVQAGVWFHIVAGWDGSNVKIFVNNSGTTGQAFAGPIWHSNANLEFGSFGGGVGDCDGCLDEVAYWNRWLTTDEIAQLYNGGTVNPYPFGVVGVGGFLHGTVDQLGLWKRALTGRELVALYGVNQDPDYSNFNRWETYMYPPLDIPPDMMCYWNFNGTNWLKNKLGAEQYNFYESGTTYTCQGMMDSGRLLIDEASGSLYIPESHIGYLSPGANSFSIHLWINGTIFKDMVGYWSLGEDQGEVRKDITSKHMDLYEEEGFAIPAAAAVVGNGASFTNTDQTLVMNYGQPERTRLRANEISGITIAGWNYMTNSDDTMISCKVGLVTSFLNYNTAYNKYGFFLNSAANGVYYDYIVPTSHWDFVAGVWNKALGSGLISVNNSGWYQSGVNPPTSLADTADQKIYVANPWSGILDEYGVWYRPLSGVEINKLYNAGAGWDLRNHRMCIFDMPGSYKLCTSGDKMVFSLWNNAGVKYSVTGDAHLSEPGWKHVACNFNRAGNNIQLYVNGQQNQSSVGASTTVGTATGPFRVGHSGVSLLQIDSMVYWYGSRQIQRHIREMYNRGDGVDLEWIMDH